MPRIQGKTVIYTLAEAKAIFRELAFGELQKAGLRPLSGIANVRLRHTQKEDETWIEVTLPTV